MTFQIFDNEEFDCRTPEDWLALGCEQGSSDQKPVPAKAFLPTHDTMSAGTEHSQTRVLYKQNFTRRYIYIYLSLCDFFGVEEQKKSTPEYTWQSVGVLDYSPEKKQYMVQKADQNGCVRDSKGKPVVGGAQSNKGTCQRVKLI